ncbi:MAG: rRNA maturation RNase YbeY [Fibromonadaceae bacterium]|jgi:probable rRNA maturation factor|nr:rRNA maturation RNase YbeY [Fibromonadaceae bacterium]
MSCNFFSTETKKFPWQKRFKPVAEALLKKEKKNAYVNIILCNDVKLRELNKKYRKQDRVTDVLSFVWNSELLGEIYIAKGQVQKQAPIYGNTYYKELKRVLIHGLLHLCGYDHRNKNERKIMREQEAAY